MHFSEAVERIEKHPIFNDEKGYLVHGFLTHDGTWSDWQVGYYDADADTVTPYTASADHVVRGEPASVFKDGGKVPPLARDEVLFTYVGAATKAHNRLAKQHPGHNATKTILLVQKIDDQPVYNVTIVTDTLHIYNVKVHAKTAQVVSENFDSILSLRKDE